MLGTIRLLLNIPVRNTAVAVGSGLKMNSRQLISCSIVNISFQQLRTTMEARRRLLSMTTGEKASSRENESGEATTSLRDVSANNPLPAGPAERKIISLEESIKYLNSSAYKQTYGENPVWVPYRRNFKGQFAPKRTRQSCFRGRKISTGNPCPLCRDEYLILDYRNEKLLQQFISPYNGEVLSSFKTGVCQVKHAKLLVEIEKAKQQGILTLDTHFKEYNYAEFRALHATY